MEQKRNRSRTYSSVYYYTVITDILRNWLVIILMTASAAMLMYVHLYNDYRPEISEVYVRPEYRRRKIASRMILFAEEYCEKNYPLHKFELLTGGKNLIAQSVYDRLGYKNDHELHLSKRVER